MSNDKALRGDGKHHGTRMENEDAALRGGTQPDHEARIATIEATIYTPQGMSAGNAMWLVGEVRRLREVLVELAHCDGSTANVANAEILAERVRIVARAALSGEAGQNE